MNPGPTSVGRRSRRRRRLIAAICAAAILLAWVFGWGFVRDRRDEREAAKVLEQFRDAVNVKDYETACGLLASTALHRADGATRCPSRLRQSKDMIAEWDYILPGELEADVYQRDHGRVRVIPRPKADTLFDAGPTYRFVFVDENGSLRLEHWLGRF